MVWNNAHKSSRFNRIYSKDSHDFGKRMRDNFDKRMRNNFSILDCVLDENKAKQSVLKNIILTFLERNDRTVA